MNLPPKDQLRKQRALDLIEQAQGLVADAATEICPLDGYADEWSDLIELRATIRSTWDRIESKRFPTPESNDS